MRLRDCFYNVTSTLYCMYDDLCLDGLGGRGMENWNFGMR